MVTAIGTAGYLLCYQQATSYGERSSIVLTLLFCSALLNSGLTLARIRQTPRPNRSWVLSAFVLATMTIGGSVTLAAALPRLGAGVASTLLQLQVFFVALGAWVFLRERVGLGLLLGAAMAAGGVAVYALPGSDAAKISSLGVILALGTVASFSGMLVWTRAVIRDLDPISLNAGRLWVATVAMALWPGAFRGALEMPWQGVALAAGAAAGGPFIARISVMYSLRYIDAAKAKLWSMLTPVFTFLLVFLVFGTIPSAAEVIGGTLIVSGVFLPTLVRVVSASRRPAL